MTVLNLTLFFWEISILFLHFFADLIQQRKSQILAIQHKPLTLRRSLKEKALEKVT